MRKAPLIASALMVTALVVLVALPASAQAGGACHLDGTVVLSPGLTNTEAPFTYTLTATLSDCQSNIAGAPASGTVEVGQVVTDPTGEQFQEPAATGSGNCAHGSSTATAVTRWADGTISVITYTADAVTGAVNITGKVVPNVTIPAINPLPGQPTTKTINTTRYNGDDVQGAAAFQADPAQCAGAGVKSAHVSAIVGIGHQ